MVSVTQQTIATGPPSLGQVTRPASALIGWMPHSEACLLLAGHNAANIDQASLGERAQAAIAAVSQRPDGVQQDSVLSDVPGQDLGSDMSIDLFASHGRASFRSVMVFPVQVRPRTVC